MRTLPVNSNFCKKNPDLEMKRRIIGIFLNRAEKCYELWTYLDFLHWQGEAIPVTQDKNISNIVLTSLEYNTEASFSTSYFHSFCSLPFSGNRKHSCLMISNLSSVSLVLGFLYFVRIFCFVISAKLLNILSECISRLNQDIVLT